jgi:acetylornithine/succinyldiaminopimelate/putrescine aminotransferase
MISTTSDQELLEEFAAYVSPQKAATYRLAGWDFVPGRREGVRVWDWEGKRSWIDCRTAGGVFNLGHRPPAIIEAVKQGLDEADMGDHMLASAYRARLAHRLADLTPGDLQYTTFGAAGGEANDFAIKLARGYTGRPGVISAVKGYHGHTGMALAATDDYGNRWGPLAPGFQRIPFGDIAAAERAVSGETAAVIMETIPATAGFTVPPDDWYPRLRRLCDERGALLILDEVQAGLGRTGRLWAYEEWDVVPDIMVLGKGMSSALIPLSSATYRKHLQSFFDADAFCHLSSGGGSDLACIAALAMLEIVSAPAFLEHVRAMGERFEAGFEVLADRHAELFKAWNRRGLMIGLILASEDIGPRMTRALAKHGVIAVFSGFNRQILQLMPPLVIQPPEVDEVLDALDHAMVEVERDLKM